MLRPYDVKFLIPKEYNDLKQPLKDIEAEIQNIETEEEKLDFIKSRVVSKVMVLTI